MRVHLFCLKSTTKKGKGATKTHVPNIDIDNNLHAKSIYPIYGLLVD